MNSYPTLPIGEIMLNPVRRRISGDKKTHDDAARGLFKLRLGMARLHAQLDNPLRSRPTPPRTIREWITLHGAHTHTSTAWSEPVRRGGFGMVVDVHENKCFPPSLRGACCHSLTASSAFSREFAGGADSRPLCSAPSALIELPHGRLGAPPMLASAFTFGLDARS